jgi:hypothetical protein
LPPFDGRGWLKDVGRRREPGTGKNVYAGSA